MGLTREQHELRTKNYEEWIIKDKLPRYEKSSSNTMSPPSEESVAQFKTTIGTKIKAFKRAHLISKRTFYSVSVISALSSTIASIISGYNAYYTGQVQLTIIVSVLSGLGGVSATINSITEAKTFIDFQNAQNKLELILHSFQIGMTATAFNYSKKKYEELVRDTDNLRSSIFYKE